MAKIPKSKRARGWRYAALFRLSEELAAATEKEEISASIVEGLHDTLGYDFVALFYLEERTGNRVLAGSTGFKTPKTPLLPGDGLSEQPILDGKLQYRPDVTKAPKYTYGVGGSEVDVPIWVGGKVRGVIVTESQKLDDFDEEDFEVLTAAANIIGLALDKADLLNATRRRAEELEALRTTMTEVTAELELPVLLKAIVERAADLL